MDHSTKRGPGCHPRKNFEKIYSIWRILAIFCGRKARLKIAILVLKVTILSLICKKYSENNIYFLIQCPTHLKNLEESWNFVSLEKLRKVRKFQSWSGNSTVHEIP